jgi:hypothetical protein
MKRTVVLFVFALATMVTMAIPFAAFAQNSASENAQVSARVISSLSIAKNQDLDFGKVAQGVGNVNIPAENPKAVKFTISGEANENVKVTFTSPSNLLSGSNTLPFTSSVKADAVGTGSSASAITSGGNLSLNSDGKAFVYLGGSINVAAAQPRGNYSGTFSIQVEYN